MRGLLKRWLTRAPAPLAEAVKVVADLVPAQWKYGRNYRDAVSFLEMSEHWDLDMLVAYQERRLQEVMNHCYTNVPYYREVFHKAGLTPADIKTAVDLQKLPFLTKETVRLRKRDFVAAGFSPRKRLVDTTSGTTGTPLDLYVDTATRAMERAVALRHLLWLGYRKGDRIAELRGAWFSDPEKICRYFPGSKRLVFSSMRVDDARLKRTVEALEGFKPVFIRAYPSALYVLSRWMAKNHRRIAPPRYIVTSSETLYPWVKEQAAAVFNAPVVDHYGQVEHVATAFQCSLAQGYHIQMEQAVVELVPVGEDGCEIVGTSLTATGMPFIRYRTGDIAEPGETECPCGRKHPLISKITGRKGEFIVTPERNFVASMTMDFAFDHLEEIKEGQIVQEDLSTLRVKLVPWQTISEFTRETLRNRIHAHLGPTNMKVIIEEVQQIPRNSRGKKPFMVSHLRVEDYV